MKPNLKTIFAIEPQKYKVTPKTYTNIYATHKYWAKKPHNIINNLIQKYSKKNEIVLDPFCGSGISIIESFNSKRRAIGIDINPVAIFITKELLDKIDISKIENEFKKIDNDCSEKINNLYRIKRNGHDLIGSHFIWSNGKMVEVRYFSKGERWVKLRPSRWDKKFAKTFSYSKIPYYFPKKHLFHNSRINADSKMRICDLFTPRNTYALSILLNRINKIKNRQARDLFKFCFSSALSQSSKMVFVINNHISRNGEKKRTSRRLVGSWVIGYWVPKEHFEMNVWNCFVRRYNRIIAAKKEQFRSSHPPKLVSNFKRLKKGNLLLINKPALKALKKIPSRSIDYVIADPPHGDRIPYLELSMMWNSWLKNEVNYNDEIVISSAKKRNKDIHNYNKLLEQTFNEVFRVLKPNKYVTLMYNTNNYQTWSGLLNIIKKSGLKIHEIDTINYSQNSVVQENRNGGLKYDFLLTYKKLKSS